MDERARFMNDLVAAGALPTGPTPRPSQAEFDAYHNNRLQVYPTPAAITPAPAPALAQATGRRDAAPMSIPKPMLSDQQIGLGEALIRIGGQGVKAAQDGGLNSIGAMTDQYGLIQDYNRSAALNEYNAVAKAQNDQAAADSLAKYRQGLLDAKFAKIKADQAKGMKGGNVIDALAYTTPTITAIDSVLSRVTNAASTYNPFDNVTGMMGSIMSAIPGTPAHDVKMDIQTIQAAVGFDRLQAMRDASPTGGALGQVSERELAQLNASLGALEQSQSREQFVTRMQAVKQHYLAAVKAIQAQQEAYASGMRANSSSTASPDTEADKFAEADAIVNNS